MAEKKVYRNAIRSKKLIRQAFLELLKEKEFEKITVTDIVKYADINRSTFYAHYPDVMGLLDEIQEEILSFMDNYLSKLDFAELLQDPKPYLRMIVKVAEQNEELFRLLSNSSVAVKHMENLKKLLVKRIISTVKAPEQYKDKFEFEFAVRFFLGGFIDIYNQWLVGEIEYNMEDVINEVSGLIIKAYKYDISKQE